jgi:hypothetical protein
MDGHVGSERDSRWREPVAGYEPPRVEQVLTPADLEREILYAGVDSPPPTAP